MNSEVEMRQVLLHAAEKLNAAKDVTRTCTRNHMSHDGPTWNLPKDVLLSMGYAEGILRLLATYLKYDEKPQSNGHQPAPAESKAPRVPEGTGGSNGAAAPSAYHSNVEKTERNAAVVAAIRAGERQQDVATRFGISPSRVRGILAAAERKSSQTG